MSEVLNTKHIQLQSVINYMEMLGWYYSTHLRCFCANKYAPKGLWMVSLRTATSLHNNDGLMVSRDGRGFRGAFDFLDAYTLNKAKAAKIVKKAKLQITKRKEIVVQCHKIELVDRAYYDLFMKELE